MTLRTGNKGFTLIEVMAAAVILCLGAVFIFSSFYTTLDAVGYYRDCLSLIPWMDEKLWEARNALERTGGLGGIDRSGQATVSGRPLAWSLASSTEDMADGLSLFQVEFRGSWKAGSRPVKIKRIAYALYRQKMQK